nr:MAG TPA: hypothetical protein [Inoviridae sp.]
MCFALHSGNFLRCLSGGLKRITVEISVIFDFIVLNIRRSVNRFLKKNLNICVKYDYNLLDMTF